MKIYMLTDNNPYYGCDPKVKMLFKSRDKAVKVSNRLNEERFNEWVDDYEFDEGDNNLTREEIIEITESCKDFVVYEMEIIE